MPENANVGSWTLWDASMMSDLNLLGEEKVFPVQVLFNDNIPSAKRPPLASGYTIRARLSFNTHSSTVALGSRVARYTGTTYGFASGDVAGDEAGHAGFVSPWLPTAPATLTFFPLIIEGPCLVQTDDAGDLTVGDVLVGAATGFVKEHAGAADPDYATCGRKIWTTLTAAAGAAGDLTWAYVVTPTM